MDIRHYKLWTFSLLLILLLGCTSKTRVVSPDADIPSEEDILPEEQTDIETVKEEPITIKSPLTGGNILEELEGKRIMSVMVENEYYSRPQSGLDKACLVYEALAEGGITRFLALYLDEPLQEIGPVRSSRPYFLDWAMEYDSVYVHYGASPHAYTDLAKLKIPAIDGIYDTKTFWRDKSRNAPHNAYTDTDRILTAAKQRGYRETSDFPGLKFKDTETPPGGGILKEFYITYFKDYKVNYIYDDLKMAYLRHINGKPHTDRTSGETLSAKNIILQFVVTTDIPGDKEGRLNLKTVGAGKGYYISDGEYVKIHWKKDSRQALTQYTLEDGQELILNPGNTWIQILPQWGEFSGES